MPNYCLKEYIGEWNGIHYYYCEELFPNGDCGPLQVLITDSPDLPIVPCPCPNPIPGIRAEAVPVPPQPPRRAAARAQAQAAQVQPGMGGDLEVSCLISLNVNGTDDFVSPKRGNQASDNGRSLVARGMFKTNSQHAVMEDRTVADGNKQLRLLDISGRTEGGTFTTFKLGQEDQGRDVAQGSHFRQFQHQDGSIYFVLEAGVGRG